MIQTLLARVLIIAMLCEVVSKPEVDRNSITADDIADLNDRLVGLQQAKDAEKEQYESELQKLRNKFQETKDQLTSENMILRQHPKTADKRVRRSKECWCHRDDIKNVAVIWRITDNKDCYGERETVNVLCDYMHRMKLNATEKMQCTATGWGPIPQCYRICPSFLQLLNGTVEGPLDAIKGEHVDFTCNTGFHLVGSQRAVCDENGDWNVTNMPVCVKTVDGGYKEWTNWESCSETCGTGSQSRSRDCTNPAPQYEDNNCVGDAIETQDCNTNPCPIDGGFNEWTAWISCPVSCGTGSQSRSRNCTNPAPQYGGSDCIGNSTETQDCNTNKCSIDWWIILLIVIAFICGIGVGFFLYKITRKNQPSSEKSEEASTIILQDVEEPEQRQTSSEQGQSDESEISICERSTFQSSDDNGNYNSMRMAERLPLRVYEAST